MTIATKNISKIELITEMDSSVSVETWNISF